MSLPLSGITVLALEQAVAAPLASRQLADLGARVVKVERPDGGDFARAYDSVVDGVSSVFVWLNRGKESVQLDLKDPAGSAALHRLVASADVLVANLAPAVLRRLGLTAPALREHYPDLIVCTISGYASDGPNRTKKAYDALIQAEAGLMSQTGTPENPAKVGISIADIAGGTHALSGILAAIRHRDQTGEALPIEVSLFGALAEWMAYPLYYTQHGKVAPEPMGTAHPTIAPYGSFRAADDGSVMIAVQNDREWTRLCTEVLDAPELAVDRRFLSNADRVAYRAELEAALRARFARYSDNVLTERLETAGIAWGRLTEIAALAEHPELAAPDRWMDTEVGDARVPTLRPTGIPGVRTTPSARVPALGEHTEAVLAEFTTGSDASEAEEGDR